MDKKQAQKEHIEVLQRIATCGGAGTLPIYQGIVKVSGRDIIDAGLRLQEIGVFNFGENQGITVKVEYVRAENPDRIETKKPKINKK